MKKSYEGDNLVKRGILRVLHLCVWVWERNTIWLALSMTNSSNLSLNVCGGGGGVCVKCEGVLFNMVKWITHDIFLLQLIFYSTLQIFDTWENKADEKDCNSCFDSVFQKGYFILIWFVDFFGIIQFLLLLKILLTSQVFKVTLK